MMTFGSKMLCNSCTVFTRIWQLRVKYPVMNTPPNTSPLGLSTSQAAQALGVSLGTIRRWSDLGYLQSYRTPGGQRRFSQEQIQKFVGSLEQQTTDPLVHRKVG